MKLNDTNKERANLILLVAVATALTVFFSWFCILRHYGLESRDFDLGVLSNVIINTAHGNVLRSSYYGGQSFLGVHVVPLYLLLGLLYRLIPHIEMLLILQSAVVCFAAVPLYRIAKLNGFSSLQAALIALMYLFHPANHGALFYDFHELAFYPAAFFLFTYCLLSDRRVAAWAFLVVCCFIKEDLAIVLLAALPLLSLKSKTLKSSHAVFALLGWYLFTVALRAYFGESAHPFWWYYKDLIPEGYSGITGIVTGIVTNPSYFVVSRFTSERFLYVLQISLPVLFIPFATWYSFLALVPGFLMTILSSNEKWELFSIGFQYVWYILPPLFVGYVLVLRRYSERTISILLALSVFATLGLSWRYGAVLDQSRFVGGYRQVNFDPSSETLAYRKEIFEAQREIPPEDWIVCSSEICPQLSEHINVIPCRMWYHDTQKFVRWAFVTDAKNCSEKSLNRLGFQVQKQIGEARLWSKDCQSNSCL